MQLYFHTKMETYLLLILVLSTAHCSCKPIVTSTEDSLSLIQPKDLFSNLWSSTPSQTNVVRTLQYSPNVPLSTCGQFTFSLAGLNEAVHILQAQLHLWFTVHSSPQQEAYIAGIQPVHADGRVSTLITRNINTSSSHYVTFEVKKLLKDFLFEGKTSILFQVSIDRSLNDSSTERGYNQDVSFACKNFTNTTMPSLIAFTYDQSIEEIDFKTIAKSIHLHSTPLPHLKPSFRREKRGVDACSVKSLTVPATSEILQAVVAHVTNTSDFTIVHPRTFNIGVCGGICDYGAPLLSPSLHAPLLDILIKQNKFPGVKFKACCVPVKYSSLTVNILSQGSLISVKVNNALVSECECLDTLA